MNKNTVKWIAIAHHRAAKVTSRLRMIQKIRPSGIMAPVHFSTTPQNGPKTILRIETPYAAGTALSDLNLNARTTAKISGRLKGDLADWKIKGFAHGDLTPSNILISGTFDGLHIHYIDYKIDLELNQFTPRYSATKNRKATSESDQIALDMILDELHDKSV